MNTTMLIIGSLAAGGLWGYWLGMVLHRDIPTRPEALAAEPREIVAVYEAKREMERLTTPAPPKSGGEPYDLVMVDYHPMSAKALKWEREQNKKEMGRR